MPQRRYLSIEENDFNQKKSDFLKKVFFKGELDKYTNLAKKNPQKAMWCFIELWLKLCDQIHHQSIELKLARKEPDKKFYQDILSDMELQQSTIREQLTSLLDKVIEQHPTPDYFLENPKLISYALVFSNTFLQKYKVSLPQIFEVFANLKKLEVMSELVRLVDEKALFVIAYSFPERFDQFIELLLSSSLLLKTFFHSLEWLKTIQITYPELVAKIIDKALKDNALFSQLVIFRFFDENAIDYFASIGTNDDRQRWKMLLSSTKEILGCIRRHTTTNEIKSADYMSDHMKNEFNGRFFDGYQAYLNYSVELLDSSFEVVLEKVLTTNDDHRMQYLKDRIKWGIELKIFDEKELKDYLDTIRLLQTKFPVSKYNSQLIELGKLIYQPINSNLKVTQVSMFVPPSPVFCDEKMVISTRYSS